jgi:SAM-dependent methyltransferase
MKDVIGKYLLHWRIQKVLPHVNGKLLDIGCGTNELVKAYSGRGIGVDVYGWDGVDLVVEDTAKLPYKVQEFDSVTIIAALNHIPNREEVLKEAHRVLNKSGKIIITMISPFISTIWHKIREPWDVDQNERGMKKGEVYGLTRREVNALLKNAGFNVAYESRFMMGFNMLTVAVKSQTIE